MGKGSKLRKGANLKAFKSNEDYWQSCEWKKEFICWQCQNSWKCDKAYQNKDICIK